jgi:hypothetical protein
MDHHFVADGEDMLATLVSRTLARSGRSRRLSNQQPALWRGVRRSMGRNNRAGRRGEKSIGRILICRARRRFRAVVRYQFLSMIAGTESSKKRLRLRFLGFGKNAMLGGCHRLSGTQIEQLQICCEFPYLSSSCPPLPQPFQTRERMFSGSSQLSHRLFE